MKKILAILLALMLVLVNVAALAEIPDPDAGETPVEETPEVTPAEGNKVVSVDPTKLTIEKVITIEDTTTENSQTPADELKFTVTPSEDFTTAEIPEGKTGADYPVKIEGGKINAGDTTTTLTFTLPHYDVVGIYNYDITEEHKNFAGMTYAENLKLKITVITGENGDPEPAGIAIRQDDEKVTEIENKYAAGDLKVTKTVDGNLGDLTKEFPITITFEVEDKDQEIGSIITYVIKNEDGTAVGDTQTAEGLEIKVNLKSGQYVEVYNIPEGVNYTVVEDDDITHAAAADTDPTDPNSYLVEGEVTENTAIVAAEMKEETITNTKGMEPDTGIELETLPYVLLMVLAIVGFAMMNTRKREDY